MVLGSLMIIVVGINLLLPFIIDHEQNDFSAYEAEVAAFRARQQHLQDSAYNEPLQSRRASDQAPAAQRIKPFPFDPNQLPWEKWQQMGFTDRQIRTIKNYEAHGGKFRTSNDLKKIYTITAHEFDILEPYIQLPANEQPATKPTPEQKPKKTSNYSEVELNSCDSMQLVQQLHFAPWLAERTIKYRKLLGGFYSSKQLLEVYGLDTAFYQSISEFVRIDTTLIVGLNINEADFKTLNRHPYISYELTKYTVNKRSREGRFLSVTDFLQSEEVPVSLAVKLRPYLKVTD